MAGFFSKLKNLFTTSDVSEEFYEELEERLLGRYFPDCLEESLFAEVTDKQKCLLEAYRKQAKKIAYIAEK